MKWIVLLLTLCCSVAFAQDPNEDPTEIYVNGDGVPAGNLNLNGNVVLDLSQVLSLGSACTTSHSLVTSDVCFGAGAAVEFDDVTWFDQQINVGFALALVDNVAITIGSSTDVALYWATSQDNDGLIFGVDAGSADQSGDIIITENSNRAKNHHLNLNTELRLCIFDANTDPDSDATKYGCQYHDGTDYVIDVGTGSIKMNDNVQLIDTTTSATGVILKGSNRFLHNFHHPTGGGALPDGKNVFLGELSGNFTMGSTASAATHSSNNIGIGHSTLVGTTTGNRNIGIGTDALNDITTGAANTGIGYTSLSLLVTGVYNTGLGDSSLANATGSNNTAIGALSLGQITSGTSNVAVGLSAGERITGGATANQTSTTSIYLGRNTRASANGNVNEIIIGDSVTGNGSNTATLGNSSVTKTYLQGGVKVGDQVHATAWTEPAACAAGTLGMMQMVDDTNDTGWSVMCVCANLDGTGYDWRDLSDISGTACPFY